MTVVQPDFSVVSPIGHNGFLQECNYIEQAGRLSHRSDSIGAPFEFVRKMIKYGHEATLEFGRMIVKLRTDRGVTHELVRHRLCSFVQESTRYVDYLDDIWFIQPADFEVWSDARKNAWVDAMRQAEEQYKAMRVAGCTPEEARAVLPNSTCTNIMVGANFREWRHIFRLRAISDKAHPDMRALIVPLYNHVKHEWPAIFDMGEVEV